MFLDPISLIFKIIILFPAITLHEFAHAFMADKLGDPTPKVMGRLTLNPLAHLDPLGALAILFANFGWGKPVMFDPYNLANPKRDSMLISLAGPASNMLLAILLAVLLKFVQVDSLLNIFLQITISMNIGLAVFNLLPVPPLDGSKILAFFLSNENAAKLESMPSQYTFFIFLVLILPIAGMSIASRIISPIIDAILHLLL
ncbi:site-2 protease family protein [Candidatus Beckwithbacteria bacterium]|nr:site-2 protease family protein [Candidatus Beckwithbacteria bacterium]